MRKVITLVIILISFQNAQARRVNGFFVNNNNDTIQAVFRLKTIFREKLDLSSFSRVIRYSVNYQGVKELWPKDTKFVKIKDGSIGEYDIYPVQLDHLKIFAICLVKGPLSVYKSQGYREKYVINNPSMSMGASYFVQLKGMPIAVNSITPFDDKFWIGYLGNKYSDFTECLQWDDAQKNQMENQGTPCFFEGKSTVEIAEEFNKKYP